MDISLLKKLNNSEKFALYCAFDKTKRNQRGKDFVKYVLTYQNQYNETEPYFKEGDKIIFARGVFISSVYPGIIISYDGKINKNYIGPPFYEHVYLVKETSQIPCGKSDKIWGSRLVPANGLVYKKYNEDYYNELIKKDRSRDKEILF